MKKLRLASLVVSTSLMLSLLSGCSPIEQSDKPDTTTSAETSTRKKPSDSFIPGTLDVDYAPLNSITVTNGVKLSNLAATTAGNKVQPYITSIDGSINLASPIFNVTESTRFDFNLEAGTRVWAAFSDSSITAIYSSPRDAIEMTGKTATLKDLPEYASVNPRRLFYFLTVHTETVDGAKAQYVIPVTLAGSLPVPQAAIDAANGVMHFSEDVEVRYIPTNNYSTLQGKFDDSVSGFPYNLEGAEFNESLEGSSIFGVAFVAKGDGLNLHTRVGASYGTLIYRAVDKNTRAYSSWCAVDMDTYANAIFAEVSVPLAVEDCVTTTSVDEWLAAVPATGIATTVAGNEFSVPVVYTTPSGTKDLAGGLVEPGNSVINGSVINAWMLEVSAGAQCTVGGNVIFGGSGSTMFAFPSSFSRSDCETALSRLVERQDKLTTSWVEEVNRTLGYISPEVLGAATYANTSSWSLGVFLNGKQETASPGNTETSIPSSSSSVQQTPSSSSKTSTTFSSSSTEQYAPVDEDSTSIITRELNNYTREKGYIELPMEYGTVRLNGEDLGQIVTALYLFSGETKFTVPTAYFNLQDYKVGMQYGLNLVPDIVTTQNPMLGYLASTQCSMSADQSELTFEVDFTTSPDTLAKWQPAMYLAAESIANRIESAGYSSSKDKYYAINRALCEMAAYNHDAVSKVGLYRKDIKNTDLLTQSAWSPYGVLCNQTGVCYSYAQSFKLVCDILGLDCISVTGTLSGGGHIWNKVKIDGKWYIMDATNNDNETDIDAFSDKLCLVPDYMLSDMLSEDETIYFSAKYKADDIKGTVNDKDCWQGDTVSRSELRNYIKTHFKKGELFAVRLSDDLEDFTPNDLLGGWCNLIAELHKAKDIDVSDCGLAYSANIFYIIPDGIMD